MRACVSVCEGYGNELAMAVAMLRKVDQKLRNRNEAGSS